MRQLVVSDLHLGAHTGADVLTRPEALTPLLERLDGIDRLVLLGDTLELRHGPTRDALAVAEPVLRALGDALAPGAQVVLVPGNHDHAIGAGWLDWRTRREAPQPLALDERMPAERASWIAKRMASWLGPADVELAYPGLWLRDDVYAIHGHYLDAHVVIPTIERLAIGALARMTGPIADPATPDDYEAAMAPIYALIQASAQRVGGQRTALGKRSAVGAWKSLATKGRARPLRGYAMALPFKLGVAAANRAGLGPLQADIGVVQLRRSALAAIAEVARRLRLAPAHLLFGHTHRTGMLEGDDAAEWRTPSGIALHNGGSWVYETHFTSRSLRGTPYWPGGAIALDDEGPPRLERLLDDVSERTLAP